MIGMILAILLSIGVILLWTYIFDKVIGEM